MIDLLMHQLIYPRAQPQSSGVVSVPAVLRYNQRGEIAVEAPGWEVDSFAEPLADDVAACFGALQVGQGHRMELQRRIEFP